MKKFILLIFIASLLFAVQPVPRKNKTSSDNKPKINVVNKGKPSYYTQNPAKTKGHDRFEDADSNSINDKREDDFQKIKKMNSKFKDKYKKKDTDKKGKPKKTGKIQKKKTK
jgi:hypothetical protein